MQHQVLIVDDEPAICWALEKTLAGEGHSATIASSAEEGLRLAEDQEFSMAFLDVRLPGMDGIKALPKFIERTAAPIVIITAFGDLETAVAAVKNGASDYLTKPFRLEDVLQVCRRTLQTVEQSRVEKAQTAKPTHTPPSAASMVGGSAAMQQVFRQIALVADSDLSVLITGETGTGKELVAAAIAKHSARSQQPYIVTAPVALNPELIESELFGHVKGAFTGAIADREGLFEQAAGGTILLDEIGDLPMRIQVKLLRVLESGEFSRVGEVRSRIADVRVIAATNCDLVKAIGKGEFREDLYHRLSGMQIHLPPLRERIDDILPLCEHFLSRLSTPVSIDLSDNIIEELQRRPWYGNIRELKNAIEHAAVIARGRPLAIEDLPTTTVHHPGDGDDAVSSGLPETVVEKWVHRQLAEDDSNNANLHAKFLDDFEPALMRRVLQHTGGNRAKAAEILGIHRSTLRERCKEYGLD
ncbi:sigma-54 dependent transcriptional regulator [Stieleria sp. JC731]|uniref:sigma-54-dependent transcriptional regulator n=1 Tax=Pirellulaceae TaxID=2691357 RepID=UPI001E28C3D7|nr:sigma-54 dependent transcriptional regulator [Stieleria sp. JC731]MCC9599068.1 sigma-54 dependent transcriptional regulator [Stieleria sp. JC731]